MNKNFFVVLFFLISFCSCFSNPIKKYKIVVFTSKGGNGHMSACAVLKDILSECEIKLINPIYDFFHSFFDGEEWYSATIRNGYIGPANLIVRYPGTAFFKLRYKTFEKRFKKFLQEEKPDLLISVIPFLNYPAYMASKQTNTPFMIITLDADLENWLVNMNKCRDHNFVMSVKTITPRIERQLKKAKIPLSCIREVGAPLRKDFFTPKNHEQIKKEWNIPENKKVIMLMRGGTGSKKLVEYVNTLIESKKQYHLLVCVGRNNELANRLKLIKNNGPVSFSVIPFTPKIPELMAVSDLLITQPSPNVCNEAMHMNMPILVDMTSTCLFWERATIDWINLQGSGHVLKKMKYLNKLVTQLIENKNEILHIKKPTHCFNAEIKKLIMERLKN